MYSGFRRYWWKVIFGLIIVLWPILTNLVAPDITYYDYMVSLIMIYICISVGLSILIGFTGLVSLGQAGFVAIGAYTAGILTTKVSFDLLPALIASAILCGAIGFLLGLAAVRLKSTYLALVTLGFGVSVPTLLLIWEDLTGGHQGLVVDSPTILGITISGEKGLYYVVLACTLFLVWCAINITRSKAGRAFRSVRDSEIGAQAMGINLLLTRATAFSLSAIYAGVAGGLYAHLLGYLGTTDYGILASLNYLMMVVVGGAGSIYGAIAGAVFLGIIPELFARAPAGLTLVFYGSSIIIVMLILPGGLISLPRVIRLRGSGKGSFHGIA
jgi:branched-chain amino acid transport system permease protein